ncbi:MAG: glycosyltransferase family 4 protein, partial [Noviherbaspirillum sp.]
CVGCCTPDRLSKHTLLQKKRENRHVDLIWRGIRALQGHHNRDYVLQTRSMSMLKIALVTNHPPPFRIPIYQKIGRTADIALQAIFCSAREPNRQWDVPYMSFDHVFLKERFVQRGSNFIHNNPDVLAALKRLAPSVIITTGFNPTFLYAFAYAIAKGIPHVPMTDGTDVSEKSLSAWHKALRRLVYSRSCAFIAASYGGLRLYKSYGVEPERCFQSCLCIDNAAYADMPECEEKKFDLIFCGRMVQEKNPMFALGVAEGVAHRLGRRVSILFVGTGEQREAVRAQAARLPELVSAEFHGHATQHELPALYHSARIFLFPTLRDVWGVVANEACAAELPIIVSPHSGVVDELVQNGENGFVCPLNPSLWADRAAALLVGDDTYRRFARRSRALASRYTFEHAAAGVIDACRYATGERRPDRRAHPRREAG